ncbi:hypothetical protein, variant [Cladophialophora immunda]|uniref:Uncharacterized protein n=1 Tax=Cladophialophora immunda TaxID=569365 RepID=A0A0D2BC24_9EURO|nr:uncharacterized protein PV07_01825 [Cladophialophora immunda]XP_016255324.1 hypothetical protein, variant [Cladophialophora immunda]KIW35107.1 hypothetical protein PV07_01825 [Cladophialophora immunda]KIW35108.1 hypothetical protein, variant [Cladophialophora immunda]OQV03146.1 hypothetical protein CLAIMM_08231 [Cladophialophora immunda]
MTAADHPWSLVGKSSVAPGRPTWIPDHSDMQPWSTPKTSFDEALYNAAVLHMPPTSSEDELDDRIAFEAHTLGIAPRQVTSDVDRIASSVSTVTIASDSMNQSSIQSQSTTATSCASSEHRPTTQSSRRSDRAPPSPGGVSPVSTSERKKYSPLKRGFQKVASFRKRRSGALTASSTLTSISSDADTNGSEDLSMDMRSPLSVKSGQSSWSQPLSMAKSSCESPQFVDIEALQRSMGCKELLNLRMAQLDEKGRFLEFQASLMAQLQSERDLLKSQKKTMQGTAIAEQRAKIDRTVEDLEARQLEEEMKMEKEHELEKRAIMLRLRHMEAYCQNPTPPSTPVDPGSRHASIDSNYPERKVTDKDYHNLAQQYRERDIMDSLHASKINVLRGKQKRAVENLITKKEKEMEVLEREQKKELAVIDRDFSSQEADLRMVLAKKRARLESRWRTQALIERTKMEKTTGMTYAPLPDVVAIQDINSP